MPKLYRALAVFQYPADPESLKKAKAGKLDEVKWAEHTPKDKPFPAPSPEILKSWLSNECVEEVGGDD